MNDPMVDDGEVIKTGVFDRGCFVRTPERDSPAIAKPRRLVSAGLCPVGVVIPG
jgi:hypothetical protein